MLQESHGVTCQKTSFFIVTAVKTTNFTFLISVSSVHSALVRVNEELLERKVAAPV
jgi:hypothetical protein